ncbi:MAG: flagellar biosynthesis anti-sigma factor FlgM [Desulfovibrionaceae bacterium]|jgi:anti-sigma28 factor (negative regulator of flagellin synthesis)|nr:flagellar biosynthesis anti-sigma factor FlgM [Desulfovibrionaceae bacterium]
MSESSMPKKNDERTRAGLDRLVEASEERAARVAALKSAVSKGDYNIRSRELAMDIIDSLIHSVD